jgi:crossover junction endodeoxyribonuclease RuvC
MIIIGIDPGTANTGYGIIKKESPKIFKCVDYGLIKTEPSLTPPERLKKLNNELLKIIGRYRPEILVTERLYFFKNLKTVIPVSQAGGVILLCAAKKKIPVHQFTPLQVKMAIAGHGWAEKKLVQQRIKKLLKLKEIPKSDDAADALAVAMTYFMIGKA